MSLLKGIKIAAGVLAGITLLTLGGPIVGEAIATLPPAFPENTANPLTTWGVPYEDVTFPTSDGLTLRGWFIPAQQPETADGAPAQILEPLGVRHELPADDDADTGILGGDMGQQFGGTQIEYDEWKPVLRQRRTRFLLRVRLDDGVGPVGVDGAGDVLAQT